MQSTLAGFPPKKSLLLSNAELAENIGQQVVVYNLSRDFAQVMECQPDVLRQKVARYVHV